VSFVQVLVVATATAAGVVLATLILSQLVRAVIARTAGPAGAWRGAQVRRNVKRVPPSQVEPSPAVVEPSHAELPKTPVAAYVPAERSTGVKHLRRAKAEPRSARAGEEVKVRMGDHDGGSYARVGEEVAGVLSAAEHAATQIRAAAEKEAEETRQAAEKDAAATLADAQKARAEADAYAKESRAAADKYAEAARRSADNDAAAKLTEAEQRAQRAMIDAKKKAGDLLADATRRRDALTARTEDIERRIESMLTSFHGVTSELEAMLSTRRSTATTTDEVPSQEALDDALKRSAEDRSRTYAEP
jgi:hypothetical protein